jgi:glucose/arabinose dehydrogenase
MREVFARGRCAGSRRLLCPQWTVAVLAVVGSTSTFAAQQAELDLVIDGITLPVDVVPSPDEVGRFLVIDLDSGQIHVVQDRERRPTPFLEFTDRKPVSLALAPEFPRDAHAYVTYITDKDDIVLSRFDVDTNSFVVILESELILLRMPGHPRHPCGDVAFGPLDGLLYMCVGDPEHFVGSEQGAQTFDNLRGKIIRIDVSDGQPDKPYSIPSDNPLTSTGGDAIRPEIWAYGLRNPWRFTFDPTDGTMYIPDVGLNTWEELNVVSSAESKNANFGWPLSEGNFCITECSDSLSWPVFDYPHLDVQCSIIGGGVYYGDKPDWHGVYVYGDYCGGELWGLRRRDNAYEMRKLLDAGRVIPTVIGTDSRGEVLVGDQASEAIYELQLPDDVDDGWESPDSFMFRNQMREKRAGVSVHREVLETMRNSRRWRYTQWLVQLYRSVRQVFP